MDQHYFIRFKLNLNYDQYLRVYQGSAKNISVVAEDGRKVIFPARNIQQFLTRKGISGFFEMELSLDNKFKQIKKISGKF